MRTILTPKQAADLIPAGSSIMVGGFMGCGSPHAVIDALVKKGVSNLEIICNDNGLPDYGVGKLVVNKQVVKTIATHVGLNPETGKQMATDELKVDLIPQGTMAERIRAAGAGLGGILTPTGIGTIIEDGKQRLTVQEKDYLLEEPLSADIALIKAHKADKAGNLVYRLSAQNFNPMMATAALLVIAEVEEVVEIGEIDPDAVHTPGIFVHYIVKA